MSEPVNRQRQFEQRDADFGDLDMRGKSHDDDPLAELARLVGETYDPYQDVFAQETLPRDAGHTARAERREPEFAEEASKPRFPSNFAAIEAGLRGGISPHSDINVPAEVSAHDEMAGQFDDHPHVAASSPDDWMQQEQIGVLPAQPRSRRPVYIMAATIAVGVLGIGAAFALKGHGTSPGEVRTIMADAGPTKIQPPAEAPQDQASQDAAVLSKSSQPAPTQLVNREEQPVDISQAVRENLAARDAEEAKGEGNAASVPVPPSPDQMQNGAQMPAGIAPDQTASFGIDGMPQPKRVKVVSVKPDGTILPSQATAEPAPRAAKTSDQAGPVAKPSTPKSTSRVTSTPKSIASAIDDAASPAPKSASKKSKPVRVASADTGTSEATDAMSPKPVPSAGHGGFAVQLAAPGSEADAKSASSRLAKKYSKALSGHQLAFHKADSNGKSVYRVRVSSLSREDAVSLCEKLKADGGSCFVAKN